MCSNVWLAGSSIVLIMKARRYRQSFSESMQTMQEIEPTLFAVAQYFGMPQENVTFTHTIDDKRKGWEAPTVIVWGKTGIRGFISQEVV